MATEVINLNFGSNTPTSVSLLTFTDALTSVDLSANAGLSLPVAFSLVNGNWLVTFAGTGAALYAYTYRATFANGRHYNGAGTKRGTAESTGTPGVPAITSITFTFPVTSSTTGPIDADSLPLLTDAGGTYGVRRTDTGEVVVAALGATIDHPTTGEYSFTLNNAIPGVPYQASAKFIIGGVPTYPTETVTAGGGTVAPTTGTGPVAVNHNTDPVGTTSADAMRVVDSAGDGVEGVTITAYLAGDYQTGRTALAEGQGFTTTGTDGRWLQSLNLFHATNYIIYVIKPGLYGPVATALSLP
jgi:hypothetical protein